MKDMILLMSANPYTIVNDKGEVENEGLSIQYCMTGDMLPNTEDRNGQPSFFGYRVLKGSVPLENVKELTQVPSFYEADFDIKPDASGKAVLKPKAIKFKKSII